VGFIALLFERSFVNCDVSLYELFEFTKFQTYSSPLTDCLSVCLSRTALYKYDHDDDDEDY